MKLLLIILLFSSCAVSKPTGQKYAVRAVKHFSGNAYLVETDSFKQVRYTRGMGRYKVDSITKQ